MRRPSWLLALVIVATLVSVIVVILAGHEDNVHEILEVTLPVLAALLVIDHVNTRSDAQDAKLDEVHKNTNGIGEKEYRRGVEDGKRAAADE